MDSYESEAKAFMSTLDMMHPARTLQANIVYQGRVHYITLLSKLKDSINAVLQLLSSAISTRKSMAKKKSFKECGVFSEFFSGDARGVRQASVVCGRHPSASPGGSRAGSKATLQSHTSKPH